MISKQRQLFYFVGETPFKTLREAQAHDIKLLVPSMCPGDGAMISGDALPELISDWMLENAVAITDILTTTPTSRARARKTNGAKRTRKSTRPVLAPAKLPEP